MRGERERVSEIECREQHAFGRGHAAGRPRARCGSKAPQSGEPATALDQKRNSTKKQGTIVANLAKAQIKIIAKTIENHSKIIKKHPTNSLFEGQVGFQNVSFWGNFLKFQIIPKFVLERTRNVYGNWTQHRFMLAVQDRLVSTVNRRPT